MGHSNDTAMAFVRRSVEQNVVYLEVTFDPQQAIRQGVQLSECIDALRRAQGDARRDHGIEIQWIACFSGIIRLKMQWKH